MRNKIAAASLLVGGLSFASVGQAELQERLGGLAYYDTVLDITWLADANYAATSGYSADGLMTWYEAQTWVAQLEVAGVTGWRLPTLNPVNGIAINYNYTTDGSSDFGRNISRQGTIYAGTTASEMAHLFYSTLGNVSDYAPDGTFDGGCSGQPCLTNTGPFTNVQIRPYWYGVDYEPPSGSLVSAFAISPASLSQGGVPKDTPDYAWAVRDGDVASPAPTLSCVGFDSPFDQDLDLGKSKRTIPAKFTIEAEDGTDQTDADLAAPPVVNVTWVGSEGTGGIVLKSELLSPNQAEDGNQARYDADDAQWVYNVGTKGYTASGIYEVTVTSGEPSEYIIDPTCTGTFTK